MRQNLSWKQLASIEIGGAICLPVIMVGHTLYNKFGLSSACLAILAGNLILLAMGYLSAMMSYEAKLPTTDNAIHYFGKHGAKGFAGALLFAKTCWFGLQLNMMVISLESIFPELMPKQGWCLALGLMIILGAFYGIRGLSFLSSLSMPLLIGTMGYAAYAVSGQEGQSGSMPMVMDGISICIATAITAVIDMPTYFRHARTKRDSLLAVVLFLGVAVPLVEGLGVYLCLKNNEGTIMETLQRSDSIGWNIWVCLFFLLAGWTTNNTNLYSGMTCLGTLLPRMLEKNRIAIIGLIGLTLAMLQIINYFTVVLQIIGIMIGSMGIIVLVRYLLDRLGYAYEASIKQQQMHMLIWGISAAFGLSCLGSLMAVTTIPLLDACMAAALLTSTLTILTHKGDYEIIINRRN